jgi:hypothetical protein
VFAAAGVVAVDEQSPKKIGEDIQKATMDWKGLAVMVKLTVVNRQVRSARENLFATRRLADLGGSWLLCCGCVFCRRLSRSCPLLPPWSCAL